MKKSLFLTLAFCFWFSSGARGDDTLTIRSKAVSPSPLSDATLTPLPDKSGAYRLTFSSGNAVPVFETLAQKAGGKALFDGRIVASQMTISAQSGPSAIVCQGTPQQIITQLAPLFGLVSGRVGKDWVFLPRKSSAPISSRSGGMLRRFRGGSQFNLRPDVKPVNPKQLPPGTRSFEFNGDRVYRVPLLPKR